MNPQKKKKKNEMREYFSNDKKGCGSSLRRQAEAGEAGAFASYPNVSAAVMWRDVMRFCVLPLTGRECSEVT